jgi:porin
MGRSAVRRAARAALFAVLLPLAPASARAQSWLEGEHATGQWAGARGWLEERCVAVDGSWTVELARVFDGGVQERSTFHNLLDVNVTLDLEELVSLPGGTVYLDAYLLNGRVVSDDVGDWQFVSNIDSEPMHQIAELWWEQRLLDGALRWKVGKVDANGEFGWVENSSAFLHSGLSYPVTIGMPLYPDPATSVNLFVEPAGCFALGVGCYDGAAQEGVSTGGRGPKTFLGEPADLYWIAEAAVVFSLASDTLPGRLAVGTSLHTGTFERFDGGSEDGTRAFHATLDQALWRENPEAAEDLQGLGLAGLLDFADGEVSEVDLHAALGVQWTGWMADRDQDVLGLAASAVRFSDEAGFGDDWEVALELAWRVQLTPCLAVTPDLQYVVNPGGDPLLDDALVGLLRVELTF